VSRRRAINDETKRDGAWPRGRSLKNPGLAQAGLVSGQHVLKQRSELGSVQPRESHQTGIQLLQLCLRKRVEIDATNTLLCPRPLQPTEEDLGGTRIGDCALSQATFDLPSEEGSRSLRVARHMGINEVRLQVDGGAGVPACPHARIGPRQGVPGTGSSAIARLSAISKDGAMSWSRRRGFAADD